MTKEELILQAIVDEKLIDALEDKIFMLEQRIKELEYKYERKQDYDDSRY